MTIDVFAVEPTAIQLHWRALAPASHTIDVGDQSVEVHGDGGPGAVVVEGLPSGKDVDVRLDDQFVASATTLTPPPGNLLAKVATIGDLHFGETTFGELPRYRSNSDPALAHPAFCTSAAINELLAWGADVLVVKGDIAHDNRRAEYDLAGELLGDLPVPVVVIPGNHDGGDHRNHDVDACLARHGIDLVRGVDTTDLPGVRIVAFDSTQPGQKGADLEPVTPAVTAAAAEAEGGALVVMHHQLMTTPIPTYWPPGVSQRAADRFLDALGAAQPAAMVTGGHTHRHRARRHGPLLVTEVGSPKDYPGTWAGYLVYEGGIVQIVRRVSAPEAIRWTERTAGALFGAWGRWSPGRLTDRCISHPWITRD
jgi:3',5'-cyclic AMP phosphodiesterase CpdA